MFHAKKPLSAQAAGQRREESDHSFFKNSHAYLSTRKVLSDKDYIIQRLSHLLFSYSGSFQNRQGWHSRHLFLHFCVASAAMFDIA